jgi:hypothetical protein
MPTTSYIYTSIWLPATICCFHALYLCYDDKLFGIYRSFKFCGSQLPPIFEWLHISYHLTCLTTYQCNHNIVNLVLLVVPQPHLVFSRGRSVPSLGLALLHFQPCQLLVKQLDLVCLTRAIPTVVGLLRPLVPLGRPSIGKGYPQYVTSPLNPRSFSTYLWASPGHSFH